jgi:hypothetical protein
MSAIALLSLALIAADPTASLPTNQSAQSIPASSRPTIGVRWNDTASRNQVTFTPAPQLLYLMGIAGTMGMASLMITYRRIG